MDPPNEFDVLSQDVDQTLRADIDNLDQLPLASVFDVKSRLESELTRLFNALNEMGADMETPLVTNEGYPRADLDVLQIRLLRRNVNVLRNDLKAVISRAEVLMATQFEKLAAKTQEVNRNREFESRIPFAKVVDVVATSPSEVAGLKKDDKIVAFGRVHAGNHKSLSAVALCAQASENKPISVRILRDSEFHQLTLTPTKNWSGRGLLGCQIVAI
ncbi:LAMI_0E05402g1_1 [Lachancea mirantina]|uniref:Probable 26S proteasome regulatory subunit p27 n=1 Tax=Lachancea mirantina TaxID=1230905 RepID=A0A1G4JLD6_9SACH|nr:LAMI_0E05402g1_1 [Lachancea mirantina]